MFFTNCYSELLNAFLKELAKFSRNNGYLLFNVGELKEENFFSSYNLLLPKMFLWDLDCSYDNPAINLMNKNRKVLLWIRQSMKSTITFQNKVSSSKFGQKHFSWTRGKQLLQPCDLTSSKFWKFVTQCPQNVTKEKITLENCFSPQSYSTVRMLLWQSWRKLSTKGLRFSNKIPGKVLIF